MTSIILIGIGFTVWFWVSLYFILSNIQKYERIMKGKHGIRKIVITYIKHFPVALIAFVLWLAEILIIKPFLKYVLRANQ